MHDCNVLLSGTLPVNASLGPFHPQFVTGAQVPAAGNQTELSRLKA
ncbi:MAG TPA: hypothetical protein VFP71_03170 [Candidatus Angelobacter sp.]|nr:hypothetical protein [Candidatus Angelobacter sp.]